MYKLVIVEDEENIRHSLENFIPWEQMGFQVVGAFSDGSDALEYINANPCDAILTDILMSRMSGLELLRNLHESYPQIKAVILSGHSDFGYAQQAIRYKVFHYLVKPVDEDELMEVFRKIKEQLDLEKEELALADSQQADLKIMLQKSFFRALLSGGVTSESELSAYLKLLGMEQSQKDFPLFAFEVKTREPDQEEFTPEAAVKQCNLAEDAFRTIVIEERPDQWRIVLISQSPLNNPEAEKLCNERLHAFIADMGQHLPDTYAFHLTHSVTRLGDLLTGERNSANLNMPQPEQEMDKKLYESVVSDYKLLIVELDLGSWDTLDRFLDRLMLDLKDTPLTDVRFILKNLYSVIELNYKKRKVNTWDITEGKFDVNHLYSASDLEGICVCLKEDFRALCEGLRYKKTTSDHSVISRVVAYLDEHVHEDVGLETIAARYRIHPGYLSRLFKQEMGETLSEYQVRMKIEKAVVLLKEGEYKVGEVAAMVGYSASSYFSVMFKKSTGYSPREYIQRTSP